MQRTIAHLDLDTFFLSVELLQRPELKGTVCYVGGFDRGVVTSASYEARKVGIKSGMPCFKARQIYPKAIALGHSRGEYGRYSKWVTNIIAAKAPLFEKASIDEFYIDLTGMDKYFNALQFTIDLRAQIMEETKLPISFGLASNKMVAKIATDEAKPNGYLQVPHGKEKEFLANMPVSKIPGVGGHTFNVLTAMGIHLIQHIEQAGLEALEARLGKWGADLFYKSQGIHNGEVSNYHEAKSISAENTFDENKTDINFLNAEIVRLTEKIGYQLRADDKYCSCVAIKIKYANFEVVTRQATLPATALDDAIIPVAKALLKKIYKANMPIRLLGVRLSDFSNEALQTNLFNNVEKKADLYKAIDKVKDKFGKKIIKRAGGN
jgi:DNA polymerase IV